MNGITRHDMYVFLILCLTSPLWIPCGLISLALLGICWLLGQVSFLSIATIVIMAISYPFLIVTQISSYAFLHLLRERPQSDATGFSFHRRFQKKTVLWKSISVIREVWVPSGGSAFQFHFHEGQQLQIIATEETRQLIVQAKEMGIPIEEDAICKNMNNKERTVCN